MSNFQTLCQTFDVTISWAIQRKLDYLRFSLKGIGDDVSEAISKKAKASNEVEKVLAEKWLKKKVKEYRSMEHKIAYWQNPDGKISDEDIEKARSYPISELPDIKKPKGQNKGNICCPFHEDKHPSASIRDNKLHCFTCNKTWNVIDIIMEKEGLGFIEAVKYLNER